jgi:hypothetical protein
MLVEDEILFCGLVLLAGVLVGGVARWLRALREKEVVR